MTIPLPMFVFLFVVRSSCSKFLFILHSSFFIPRLGKPEEFGALVLHMIENPMINGNVIRLDGGQRMSAL